MARARLPLSLLSMSAIPSMTRRPNVLFLMSDEHRADVTGYAGSSVVRTPVLDQLARTGVTFSNAYTPSPICIPARQSLMSGLLPRNAGCEKFEHDLPPGSMTFARRFAEHGYDTVACGKLHHTGTDQMQGWTHRPAGDATVARRHVEHGPGVISARTESVNGKWSQVDEIRRAGVGTGPCQVSDRLAVDAALDHIRRHFLDPHYDRATPDTPLMLKVSLVQPHYPYLAPTSELFEYYLNRVPVYRDQQVFDHPFLGGNFVVRAGVEVTERELRRATAAYYAMIEHVDTQFGRVLAALADAGQDLDDWVIVYTSDHGEMLGEHGVVEKQKFFEGSARVPLIIRWPRTLQPSTVTKNVNLCDIFATLCDLADIPTPDGLDSRSLVPLVSHDVEDWPDETVSQFGGRNLMIKQGDLKYQSYGPRTPEVLFDLTTDPGEQTNVIDRAEHQEALTRFRARRDELRFD